MVIERSSGNEPWIFRASDPEELVGAHRERMASALGGEPIQYLLYSPSWLGEGRHFGIRGRPASHALAATEHRFIITRNAHDGSPTTVTSIPFENVLAVEKGSALLLAWFVVHFEESGKLETSTILHKSTGAHHFDETIRLWRRTLPASRQSPSLHPDEHWKSVPRFLYYEIEPVLLDGERLHASLHAQERWAERRRLFRIEHTFVQPWSSALLADRSVVLGATEQPLKPSMRAFGANVTIAPYGAVASALVAERAVRNDLVRELRIDLARDGCTLTIVAPFEGSSEVGESVAGFMRAR